MIRSGQRNESRPNHWKFDASDGELLLHTGVTGRAARMGHRLTLAMRSWQATVRCAEDDPDEPVELELTVDADSLEVLRGEGGVTPLTGADKKLIHANAMKSLRARKFPQVSMRASNIERDGDTVRLTGTLEICGRVADQVLEVDVDKHDDSWRISGEATVRHSDYGIKQFSMLMGAVKVADEVRVTFAADSA